MGVSHNQEVSDLTRELETARSLLDLAVEKGNGSLANALLSTISKLSREWELSRFRSGEVLSRQTVMRFGSQVGVAIADELKAREIGNWEEICDGIVQRILAIDMTNADLPKVGHKK